MVELLAVVSLATIRGSAWRGELVFYVTDNQNVKAWIAKRRPNNLLARHLIRLIERLEAQFGFTLVGFFVRTYHNEVADWLTREELRKVHDELEREGWERLEPPAEWGQIVADAKDLLLRLPGEEGPPALAALRQRALRRPAAIPQTITFEGQTALELGEQLKPYLDAFLQLGGSAASPPCRSTRRARKQRLASWRPISGSRPE